MNEDPVKSLWQAQDLPPVGLSVDAVRAAARRFDRRIRLRNGLEYAACLLVIVCFARYVVLFPTPLMRLGSVLVILGTLVVAWEMRKRASSRGAPNALAGVDFHRRQLERQRDALRWAWAWYVAPFLPGMAVFRWGVETELGLAAPFARGLVANLAIGAVLLGVVLLNLHAARKLQRQIDRLPPTSTDITPTP
jgi:hypothetical protein